MGAEEKKEFEQREIDRESLQSALNKSNYGVLHRDWPYGTETLAEIIANQGKPEKDKQRKAEIKLNASTKLPSTRSKVL